MNNRELYKRTFSHARSSSVITWEDYAMPKRRRFSRGMAALLVAVLITALLCGAALAANFMGLRELLIPAPERYTGGSGDGASETDNRLGAVNMISLAGYADSPESRALVEWEAFLDAYEPEGGFGSLDVDEEAVREYPGYQVYNGEMVEALESIAEKYDLKLNEGDEIIIESLEHLHELVGGEFIDADKLARYGVGGYMYENGTFMIEPDFELQGYGLISCQMLRVRKGYLTQLLLNVGDTSDYTEWSYTGRGDVPLLLALTGEKGLIIAELPDCFATVNVLCGRDSVITTFGNGPINEARLEQIADCFDFSVLSPVNAPVDPAPEG